MAQSAGPESAPHSGQLKHFGGASRRYSPWDRQHPAGPPGVDGLRGQQDADDPRRHGSVTWARCLKLTAMESAPWRHYSIS